MKDDDPRARNNARFAEYMRRLHSSPAPLPPDEAISDDDAQSRQAWAAIEARLRKRGPSTLRGAYGAWKLMDEARRRVPDILLPVPSEGASDAFRQAQAAVNEVITASCLNPALVNTSAASGAQNGLQRSAEGAGSLQDAKGARRTCAGSQPASGVSRVTNTRRLRCGENGHQCGWCHYCRQKSGRPCPATCHHCQINAEAAADAARHPEEAAAILAPTPVGTHQKKKKVERVRGFQI